MPENVVQVQYSMVLTVYAFSTENWNRAQSEIDLLMDIFVTQSNEILIESKKKKRTSKSFIISTRKVTNICTRKVL